MRDALAAAREKWRFELFAWVVMPVHAHAIFRPCGGIPLDRSLKWIKQGVAERVIARWRELDAPVLRRITRPDGTLRFWLKGGGFDRNIRNVYEFAREVRYIHRNPAERGLIQLPEEWRWSSVRWWMGQRDGEIACDPPPEPRLAWHLWKGFK